MEKLTGSPSLHSLVVTPSKSFNVISVPAGIFTFLGTKVKLEVSSITFKASNTRVGEPGASPTETHMTITFQEMDIITQEDVEQGF